jgi:hypothetical protein
MLKEKGWKYLSTDQPISMEMLSPDRLKEWPILPPEIDRTKLPGFYTRWPSGENFEKLYNQFTESYPDVEFSIDKVSLMVVWLTLRLPYQMEETEQPTIESESQSPS